MILRYCTNCDTDAPWRGGPCPDCNTTTYIIPRDSNEKCAVCGNLWGNHGTSGSNRGASACPGRGGGTFISAIGATIVFADPIIYHEEVLKRAPATSSGMFCAKCNDFNEYAQANQADGKFICYKCRH